jgi:hypothetical protein
MSEIKVNKISPKQTCTQVTLGDSGDTFTIPAGVTLTNSGTATGFGPTGAVSWNTTKITADPNPAVSGVGYFADTSSAAFTVTLPAAPSAGDIVALSDYTGTWATNNLTVGRNSSNINGAASDLILNQNNTTATLIYVDATEGWRVIDTGSLREVDGKEFIIATGGTITTCGDYKIHSFTGPGTFTVSAVGNPLGSTTVDYMVVAGGGGGGSNRGGGGGAGGYRESSGAASGCYSVSPLGSGVSALPVSAQGYPIVIGGGGTPGTGLGPTGDGGQGVPSTAFGLTAAGGGFGRAANVGANGTPGGSGGGASFFPSGYSGGTGNTPPTSPPQGNPGGNSLAPFVAGGGGGAVQAGFNANTVTSGRGGAGGNGAISSINGTPTARAGGGGGGSNSDLFPGPNAGDGGSGGGGAAGNSSGPPFSAPLLPGTPGTINTGGGGGGGAGNTPIGGCNPSGAGGSGIVIIRYKFQ